MGRWSNLSEQGERLKTLVEIVPSGPIGPFVRTKKQVQRRLRPAEIAKLVSDYRRGATVYELAEQFSIHRNTVSGILEREGVPRRGQPLTPAQVEQASRLYASGLSLAKIVPHSSVTPARSDWLYSRLA